MHLTKTNPDANLIGITAWRLAPSEGFRVRLQSKSPDRMM